VTGGPRDRVVDLGGPVRLVDHAGAGRTFVCIHGLGGAALDWQLIAPELSRRGRVLALDLPGFGDSPPTRDAPTLRRLQRTLDRLLRAEVGRPAVLVGNSLGGMLAVLQAAARPASVEGLVLLSPVLPTSVRLLPHPLTTAQFLVYALPSVGEWYVRTRRQRLGPRRLVELNLRFVAADPTAIPAALLAERAEQIARLAARPHSERTVVGVARSMLGLLAVPGGYERSIRAVAAPTLVLHGAEDRLVPARAALAVQALRSDWAVRVLDGVGHVPQLEAASTVIDEVTGWLPRLGPAAADIADHADG
jgi:pimeloyl-ACP methyl ester carboxylesterase